MVYFIERNVSIRASLQQRGELIAATVKGESSSFNPRRTSAARRTPVFGWVLLGAAMFQSAPHFSSEANLPRQRYCRVYRVSIRASLQQRGERRNPRYIYRSLRVQSAPHFSSEANVGLIEIKGRFGEGFNPRLTSAARRTLHWAMTKRFKFKFQSAPHFSSEANLPLCYFLLFRPMFQSAPHFSSEANSAGILQTDVGTIVSIRASLQQRGEPICKYM